MDAHGRLDGRVALVTGASSGIGAEVARQLAGAGASVVCAARRMDRLQGLVSEIAETGGSAAALATDVSRRDDMQALADFAVERFGRVDILVANAGIMPLSPMAECRVEDWDRMVDVNVKGVLYGVAAVLPGFLRQDSGHVVTVGSVAGRRPFPGGTVYSATKFAVRALVAGLQLELSASRGIRFTDVQPGVVDTELLEHVLDPARREEAEAAWRGKRMLHPGDVARAILFALTMPPHVNVNEILVRPTDQPT